MHPKTNTALRALSLALPGLLLCRVATADEAKPAFKLSLGNYRYNDGGTHYSGQDYNLRWRGGDSSAWLGYYRDREFGDQTRVGFDTSLQPIDEVPLYLQPSLQAATRGFVGGSFGVQAGDTWFVQAGLGRTNLRPYANLNFDPNDAWTLGLGHVDERGIRYSLSTTRDNRLHTGQQHTHAVLQVPLPHQQRLTLDALYKRGMGDDGEVRAWGGTLTWDISRWFVRIARDPKQNFSSTDATRLSTGMRF